MLFIIKEGSIVNMSPTKEFFISSLVRDIDLIKAILELIDNSIQGAKRFINKKDFENYHIKLTISRDKFIIEDNCGGITKDDMCNYAFRFGYEGNSNFKEYSSGGFGIGMKRAFFKMGNKIVLESNTKDNYFLINLNVNKWKIQNDWNIYLDKEEDPKKGEKGTRITITQLYDDISKEFSSKKFLNKLNKEIIERYEKEIENNICIDINKVRVRGTKEIETEIYKETHIENGLIIRIVINKSIYSENRSGWNIYLNNRKVINADKSKLTGWGYEKEIDDFESPKFQERFYTFRGHVYLECRNPLLLPFNTTKDGIDTNSIIYKKMVKYMNENFQKSLPSFAEDEYTNIVYKKPTKEIKMLENFLNVRSASQVGVKTYEKYLDNLRKNEY